jgi:hypothetical protein
MADHDAQIASVRDMRQRIGLLGRQDKPAPFRKRQCRFAVRATHLMAFPFCHQFGRAMQALFGLNHFVRREAILAASVLAEFDQIWRAAHRAHDLVELVDAIAVPVRELRHVAAREGRLLLRDCVEAKGRIGDDPRAIAARDLAVQLGAVGFEPFTFDVPNLDTFSGRTDLALRLQRDALDFKAAVIDPRVDVEFGQALIGDLGPAFAPALDHVRAVPVPDLLTKAVLVDRAHGQHDMGMGLGHPICTVVPMDIEVGDHAQTYELGLHEVAGKLDPLSTCHLAWNGELHLAGKLGVLADFERFDVVPEPFAVAPCLRRIFGQHHLGMDDAALGSKILVTAEPLVAQPRAGAVGG